MSKGFLLDTCFVIWLSEQEALVSMALEALADSRREEIPVFVSAETAWEMGMLIAKGRIRQIQDVGQWYLTFLRDGGFTEHPVTSTLIVSSSHRASCRHPFTRFLSIASSSQPLVNTT
jgi:PIN domain nuclease of toxin-antitoxin system